MNWLKPWAKGALKYRPPSKKHLWKHFRRYVWRVLASYQKSFLKVPNETKWFKDLLPRFHAKMCFVGENKPSRVPLWRWSPLSSRGLNHNHYHSMWPVSAKNICFAQRHSNLHPPAATNNAKETGEPTSKQPTTSKKSCNTMSRTCKKPL